MSGGIVAFIGEVEFGAELAAILAKKTTTTNKSRESEASMADKRLSDDEAGSHNSGSSNGAGGGKPSMPDYDRCVVRVIVDGAVASTIPIDAAAVADNNSFSYTKAAVVVETAVTPAYARNVRCSEHPAKAATVSAAADGGAWADNEAIWRLESRAIDRICTRDVFDAHRIYGELACHSGNSGGPVTEYGTS